MANLEHGVPITWQTVFDLGSTSKQFTAMSVLLLEQEGRLSLDDDVRKWIPELPRYANPVTIRHLLHHTSGLRDYLTLMWLRGVNFDGVTTAGDAVAIITRQRETNFEPGSEYLYSNSGYFLLSEIVRRASGKTLAEFARERIFTPLGMEVTHFHDDHTMIVPHRATGYAPRKGGDFRISMSGFEQIGDGSVMTTVEELARWDANFHTGSVGGRELLARIETRGRLTSGRELDYASGLMVGSYRGLRTIRHGGSWAGYRADFLRFPGERTSIAVLCNLTTAGPGRLAQRVADVVLAGRLSGPVTASARGQRAAEGSQRLDRSQLARYAGTYRQVETEEVREIILRGDTLMVDYGDERSVLAPLGGDRFAVQGSSWEISFSGTTLLEHVPGRPDSRFVRFARARPTAAELASYTGPYYSEELDVRWTLAADSAGLVARIPGGDTLRLRPTVSDTFVGDGIVLRFVRNGSRITAAKLNAGRVRNIGFSREAKR
jgi:CubicO group peptidase (beta-lactamase class C family)